MDEDLVRRLRNASVFYNRLSELLPNGSVTGELLDEAAELLDEAADAIEELEEKAQALAETLYAYEHPWIPVSSALPEDGSDILAVQSYCGEVRIIPANYDRGVWYDCVYNRVAEQITHWMPLPKPPKEDGK